MPYTRKPFLRRARKFVRRQAMRPLKKRYVRKNGNFKVSKLISDVQYIKNSLNTERKHLDITISNSGTANRISGNDYIFGGVARPNRTTPVIYKLGLPYRGTSYNQRVGNQIKITNIHGKFQVERFNSHNYQQTCHYKFFVFFAKTGDNDSVSIDDLYHKDANQSYTPMCRANEQQYKNFYRPKLLSTAGKIVEQTTSNSQGLSHFKYVTISQKFNTQVKFINLDDEECTTYRPYICFLSDDNSGGGSGTTSDNDRLDITGTIRITYVDN